MEAMGDEAERDPVVTLIEGVTPLVFQLAARYANRRGRPDLADDLAQGLLVTLTDRARLGKYDSRHKPTTWVYTYNKYFNRLFDELVHGIHVPVWTIPFLQGRSDTPSKLQARYLPSARAARAPIQNHQGLLEEIPRPEHEADTREEIALARQAIDELSEPDRTIVIRMFGLDGSKPEKLREAAQRLGVTKQAIHERRNRTLARLRTLFEEEQSA